MKGSSFQHRPMNLSHGIKDDKNKHMQLMKNLYTPTMNKKTIVLCLMLISIQFLNAQDDKIKFGAYSRAFQQINTLGNPGDKNANHTANGNVLMDLGININPDKKTEIQAIVRFSNNFSGFYTAGAAATLRQLYVKGTVAKYFNYQVGDMYMKLTPYTFFNNSSEGSVNEATIFSDLRRDYTNYENLSARGNAWWQQGAATNFAFAFNETFIDSIKVDAFFLRNRASYATFPSAFHAGGKITITQSPRLKIAANYVDLFDVAASLKTDTVLLYNPVATGEINYKIINGANTQLSLIGEGGYSENAHSAFKSGSTIGYFWDAGLQLNLKKQHLIISSNYIYVAPEFYSSAAQSKRVNYNNTVSNFQLYSDTMPRGISVFDLMRDPGIYNQKISRSLMSYNPMYGNAQPYGKATPNRTGLQLNMQYKDSLEKIVADVDAAYLSEIAGVGSKQYRTFLVLKGAIDFNIHKFFDWKKRLIVTTGYSFESTNRSGADAEKVNLSNNLLDLGLEVEVFKKMSVLGGYKMLTSKGNEFISVRNVYNDVIVNNNSKNMNVAQTIIAFGLKYRFSEKSYLTIQDHLFSYQDKSASNKNYSLSQILVMFNMNF